MGLEAVFSRGTSSVRKNRYLRVSFPSTRTSSTLSLVFKPLTGTQGHTYGLWKKNVVWSDAMPSSNLTHTAGHCSKPVFLLLYPVQWTVWQSTEDFLVHHDQIEFSPANMLYVLLEGTSFSVSWTANQHPCYSIQTDRCRAGTYESTFCVFSLVLIHHKHQCPAAHPSFISYRL